MRVQAGSLVLGALTSVVCALNVGQRALAPVVGHDVSARSRLAETEQRAALAPDDSRALASLVRAYVEAREPGAALAVLARAPAAAVAAPELAHAASVAYLEAGDVPRSLAAARGGLERCSEAGCDARDEARLRYRAIFASALLEDGVSDPAAEPVAADGAARRAFRRTSAAAP